MALVAIFEALEANSTPFGNTTLLLIELAVEDSNKIVKSLFCSQDG
jgi:hypothetical protein